MTNNEIEQWFGVFVGKAQPSDRATRQAAAIRDVLIAKQIDEYDLPPNPELEQYLIRRLEQKGYFEPTRLQRIFKMIGSVRFLIPSVALLASWITIFISGTIVHRTFEPTIRNQTVDFSAESSGLSSYGTAVNAGGSAQVGWVKNITVTTQLTAEIANFAYSPIADALLWNYFINGKETNSSIKELNPAGIKGLRDNFQQKSKKWQERRFLALNLAEVTPDILMLRYKNLSKFIAPNPFLPANKIDGNHNIVDDRESQLYFEVNVANLNPEHRQQLARMAIHMNVAEWMDSRFLILGCADNRGNDEDNAKLSYARALAVRQYLISKGVAAERLIPFGLGSKAPVEGSKPMDEINRRVEIWAVDD